MPTFSARGSPVIGRFLDSNAFLRGLMGPLGSGKSSACAVEIGIRGMAQKPSPDGIRHSRFAVIRNTNKQLEDTTIKTFMQWFPPEHFGVWVPSRHTYQIKALRASGDQQPADIEVLFRALDRPDQIGNLLSLELTGAWVNEAREIPWSIIEGLEGRVGRYPKKDMGGASWSGIWMDTNPPDVESEWYKFFEEIDHTERVEALAEVIPGMTVGSYRQIFKQPSGLSPNAENVPNLPLGYYQRLAIGKSTDWRRVYIDGQYGFIMDGKPVWPEYVDDVHCPSDPKQHPKPSMAHRIMRSWDFGLTPACVFSQMTPRGQWIIFDELVSTRMGADRFSDEVLAHSSRYYADGDFWDVGDPAGAQAAQTDERTCFQILHAKGIEIEPGIQTLAIRLESVRKPLTTMIDGRPQFVLHPRCKATRRGLQGGYHYRRMRIAGERFTETPEKNQFSHPCDALGYAATRWFGHNLFQARRPVVDEYRSPGIGSGGRSPITGY